MESTAIVNGAPQASRRAVSSSGVRAGWARKRWFDELILHPHSSKHDYRRQVRLKPILTYTAV